MTSLRFETGPRTGEAVVIDKSKVTFGRHLDCDCILKHLTVSRVHFYIELNGGKYFLVDENSGNGTFVNGEPVSWVEIKNGDKVQAGPFVFSVESSEESSEDAAPRASVEEGTAQDDVDEGEAMLYPREYLEGIHRFNAGDYFDAHEIWEEIWLRSSGEARLFYQALIQAAVGLHHYRRGNIRGASGMRRNVLEKLDRLPEIFMSLDLVEFRGQFTDFLGDLSGEQLARDQKPTPLIKLLKDSGE